MKRLFQIVLLLCCTTIIQANRHEMSIGIQLSTDFNEIKLSAHVSVPITNRLVVQLEQKMRLNNFTPTLEAAHFAIIPQKENSLKEKVINTFLARNVQKFIDHGINSLTFSEKTEKMLYEDLMLSKRVYTHQLEQETDVEKKEHLMNLLKINEETLQSFFIKKDSR